MFIKKFNYKTFGIIIIISFILIILGFLIQFLVNKQKILGAVISLIGIASLLITLCMATYSIHKESDRPVYDNTDINALYVDEENKDVYYSDIDLPANYDINSISV